MCNVGLRDITKQRRRNYAFKFKCCRKIFGLTDKDHITELVSAAIGPYDNLISIEKKKRFVNGA